MAKLWDAITDAPITGHGADQQRLKKLLDAKLGFQKDTSNDNASASARDALDEKIGQFLQIKATLKPDEASEITSLFITGGWPTWLTLQILADPFPVHTGNGISPSKAACGRSLTFWRRQPAPNPRMPTKKREEHRTDVDEDSRVLSRS